MPSPLPPWLPGSSVAKAVRPLLDQQFFCWGEDIKRAEGNLLLAYGFVRCRADEAKPGCSRYQLRRADGSEVLLWGGAMCLRGADGWGVFFTRAHFRPRLVPPDVSLAAAWAASDVPTLSLPQTPADGARLRQLLGESFAAIADYEEWVTQAAGEPWRAEIIARWWKPRTDAADAIRQWRDLAQAAQSTGLD